MFWGCRGFIRYLRWTASVSSEAGPRKYCNPLCSRRIFSHACQSACTGQDLDGSRIRVTSRCFVFGKFGGLHVLESVARVATILVPQRRDNPHFPQWAKSLLDEHSQKSELAFNVRWIHFGSCLVRIVPSLCIFLSLHSHNGGRPRGKFQRPILALPSIFPSKATHRCRKSQSEYRGLCFMMGREEWTVET